MIKHLIFKPWDPQKSKFQRKALRLDPWGARESKNKPRFDPVKVGKCDHLDIITKVGRFFVHRFLGNANLQKAFSTDSEPG